MNTQRCDYLLLFKYDSKPVNGYKLLTYNFTAATDLVSRGSAAMGNNAINLADPIYRLTCHAIDCLNRSFANCIRLRGLPDVLSSDTTTIECSTRLSASSSSACGTQIVNNCKGGVRGGLAAKYTWTYFGVSKASILSGVSPPTSALGLNVVPEMGHD